MSATPSPIAKKLQGLARVRELGVAAALLLEIAFFALLQHHVDGTWLILDHQNLIEIIVVSSVIGIAAIGGALVIISGGVDLSVGGGIALASVVAAGLLRAHWPPLAVVGATLAVGAFVGGLAALMVTRAQLPPFIATLALMLMTRGVAFWLTKGDNWTIEGPFTESFGNGFVPGTQVPYPALVLLLLTIATAVYLAKTAWGRQVFAVGGNAKAALYAGVNVRAITASVYIIAGMCTALAGLVFAARYGSGTSTTADGYELNAVAAAVVGGASLSGGRGSITGAVLGALIFATLNNGLSEVTGLAAYTQIVIGCVLLAAVLFDRFTQGRLQKRTHTV